MGCEAERSEALRERMCLFFLIDIKFVCTLSGTHYWNSHGIGLDALLEVTQGLFYRDNQINMWIHVALTK